MGRRAIRLAQYFERYAKGRGVMMADKLAVEIRRVLSVQAPTRTTRTGRVVAATPATPFAPPRRVTGKLQGSVKVIRTAKGASVQVYAPYGAPLELSTRWYGWPHRFIAVALANLGLGPRPSATGGGAGRQANRPAAHGWRAKVSSWFKRFTGFHGPR